MATRSTIRTGIEGAALLTVLAVGLVGFAGFVDLHVADEVGYQLAGRRLMTGDVSGRDLAYAPVFSLAYGLLDALAAAPGRLLQDWMLPLASLGSTAALWWAMRGLASPALAFFVTAWWIVSTPVLATDLLPRCNVYLFSAGLVFVAVGLAGRGRPRAALVMLAIAAFNRVELAPWLALVAGISAQRRCVSRWFGGGATAVAVAVLAIHATVPEARARSWLVFSQHFAVGVAERDPEPLGALARSPMIYHEEITGRTFGSADSLATALPAAPAAFFEHGLGNLVVLPGALVHAFATPCVHLPWLCSALLAAVGALGILGLLRRAGPSAAPSEPFARTMLWTSGVCVLVSLLVRPRGELLLPCFPAVALGVGVSAARGASVLTRGSSGVLAGFRVTALVAAALALPRPFPADRAASTPFREAVALLESEPDRPGDRSTLFGGFAAHLLFLAGRDAVGHEFQTPCGVAETGRTRIGDRLLVISYDVAFHGPGLQAWILAITAGGWRLAASGLDVWLFERER